MAFYTITWRKSSKKDLRKIPEGDVLEILQAVEALAENPFPIGSTKLMGTVSGMVRSPWVFQEVASVVRKELGLDFEVNYEPGRAFDVREIYLDISRAEAEMGWKPKTDLGGALRTTWDFVQRNSKV